MIPSNRKVKISTFKNLTNKCDVFYSNFLTLKTYPFPSKKSVFSVVVSKKNEKRAVNRNLIKRRIYKELRVILPRIKEEKICLFFVKTGLKNIDFNIIKEDIFFVLRKAGILA